MSRRHKAREMAVQMLYQRDLGRSELGEIFGRFRPAEYVAAGGEEDGEERAGSAESVLSGQSCAEVFEHARRLVSGTVEHLGEIDELVSGQAENWRLERMPAVDRNILRLAVYELLYEVDVPQLVVIDEAIELAKRYGSESSSSFVNGLLDGLIKTHTFPGSLT